MEGGTRGRWKKGDGGGREGAREQGKGCEVSWRGIEGVDKREKRSTDVSGQP